MHQPQSPYAKLAWEVIKRYTQGQDIDYLRKSSPATELREQLACFVTLHKKDGSLRGCIGTVEPVKANLHEEIIDNAIAAITRDTRFEPLRPDELDEIEVSVDVLSKPEQISDLSQLNPKKYGIIVAGQGLGKGLLLPDIEGIETVQKQLDIAKRKAGLKDFDDNMLMIYRFTSTRYY